MTDVPANPLQEIFRNDSIVTNEKLPAFFYFSISGKDSLHLPPFNQPVQYLQGKNIRIFSFNLPYHKEGVSNTDAMKEWVKEIELGQDPLKEFLTQSVKNIQSLFDQGLIDEKRCAVGGLSRGAYAAIRLAAIEPRLTHILAFAPLIDYTLLDQAGKESSPFSAFDCIDKLIGRPLSLFIGNNDTRVDTDTNYAFIRQLTLATLAAGISVPEIEFNLRPSIGFRGHGTSPETFQEGVSWLLKKFGVV